MAEGIVYLDVDDEITSAASRIRTSAGKRVALVVPYGSRIATSRMNFRLLSREAVLSNRRLSIVSGDAAARSLAASAGLPVFASVSEYESTLADVETGTAVADEPAAPAIAASSTVVASTPPAEADVPDLAASETVVIASPAPPEPTEPSEPAGTAGRRSQRLRRPVDDDTTAIAAGAGAAAAIGSPAVPIPAPPIRPGASRPLGDPRSGQADDPDADATRLPPVLGRRIRAPIVAAVGLIALALVVAGVGAYVFLPSAAVVVTPRRDPIGPIEITVGADPEVTAVDPDSSVVPALRLEVPVEAAKTFETTGVHVEEASARGSVTFTNYDTSDGVSIPSGSVVSTEGGVRFRTTRTVALQPASVFPAFAPTSGSVGVVAVKAGEQGNVPANTIRVVPQGQDPVLLRVNNPAETSGGAHTETPEIAKAEVDAAMATLQGELATAFTDAVAAGAGAPPDTTLFPETADLGTVTPSVDPKTLVGQAVPSFDLALSAVGTVIAVDPRPVETIARAELQKHVTADHRLIEDSVVIDVGAGSVGEDGQVTFQASVRASQVLVVDAATLPALVKGKTKADAETALARFGAATVTLWPDWVTTVTTVDARLSVKVDDAPGGGGAASPSPAGSARPAGSVRPAASPSRSTRPSGPAASPVAPASSASPP